MDIGCENAVGWAGASMENISYDNTTGIVTVPGLLIQHGVNENYSKNYLNGKLYCYSVIE